MHALVKFVGMVDIVHFQECARGHPVEGPGVVGGPPTPRWRTEDGSQALEPTPRVEEVGDAVQLRGRRGRRGRRIHGRGPRRMRRGRLKRWR